MGLLWQQTWDTFYADGCAHLFCPHGYPQSFHSISTTLVWVRVATPSFSKVTHAGQSIIFFSGLCCEKGHLWTDWGGEGAVLSPTIAELHHRSMIGCIRQSHWHSVWLTRAGGGGVPWNHPCGRASTEKTSSWFVNLLCFFFIDILVSFY